MQFVKNWAFHKARFALPIAVAAAVAGLTGVAAPSGADTFKAAMLLPGSINDQSWNDAGYSGLTALKGYASTSSIPRTCPIRTTRRRWPTMPRMASM